MSSSSHQPPGSDPRRSTVAKTVVESAISAPAPGAPPGPASSSPPSAPGWGSAPPVAAPSTPWGAAAPQAPGAPGWTAGPLPAGATPVTPGWTASPSPVTSSPGWGTPQGSAGGAPPGAWGAAPAQPPSAAPMGSGPGQVAAPSGWGTQPALLPAEPSPRPSGPGAAPGAGGAPATGAASAWGAAQPPPAGWGAPQSGGPAPFSGGAAWSPPHGAGYTPKKSGSGCAKLLVVSVAFGVLAVVGLVALGTKFGPQHKADITDLQAQLQGGSSPYILVQLTFHEYPEEGDPLDVTLTLSSSAAFSAPITYEWNYLALASSLPSASAPPPLERPLVIWVPVNSVLRNDVTIPENSSLLVDVELEWAGRNQDSENVGIDHFYNWN